MSHANISVFVPHLGCPHRCSFCDQISITQTEVLPTAKTVDEAISRAKQSSYYDSKNTELAFFGGSFTCIERGYMLELLDAAYQHIEKSNISGVRISTRPDGINTEILDLLKKYGVTAIELGAQSMCDDVLAINHRGHNSSDVVNASKLIKEYGFKLGLQMMTGLMGSDYIKDIKTAEKIIDLGPKTVRIYPTITLKNTYLAKCFEQGKYIPPSLDETVKFCAKLLLMFRENNINVIRLGLHSIDEQSYVAGPWHASFGELCESRIFLTKVLEMLSNMKQGDYLIYVNPKSVSKMIGNKRANIDVLKSQGYNCRVVSSEDIEVDKVEIKPERMN